VTPTDDAITFYLFLKPEKPFPGSVPRAILKFVSTSKSEWRRRKARYLMLLRRCRFCLRKNMLAWWYHVEATLSKTSSSLGEQTFPFFLVFCRDFRRLEEFGRVNKVVEEKLRIKLSMQTS
jgi:hypothetical protein